MSLHPELHRDEGGGGAGTAVSQPRDPANDSLTHQIFKGHEAHNPIRMAMADFRARPLLPGVGLPHAEGVVIGATPEHPVVEDQATDRALMPLQYLQMTMARGMGGRMSDD